MMVLQYSTVSTIGTLTSAATWLKRPHGFGVFSRVPSRALGVVVLGLAVVSIHISSARAQGKIVDCPDPESQNFIMPPEFVSSNGILKGTIYLMDEFRRLPRPRPGQPCRGARVRVFMGEGLPLPPPAEKPVPGYADAIPGPTLRARVGDLVQLRFVNKIDPNNFDKDFDIEECAKVGRDEKGDGAIYPRPFGDKFPNCLHASSTANIHFHGTHTTPNGTGDNVYLQVRPLPRDNQGNLTTDPGEAMTGFEEFFKKCAEKLQNPLNPWPAIWDDVVPRTWIDKQRELLVAYQQKNPDQRLWDLNQQVVEDNWPIYYIGAFPYCFALPAYTAPTDKNGTQIWPPPSGHPSPIMGQAPGTHWYHAHKHGSTAINVANGMTGAFIIEGKYDKELEDAYQDYVLLDENGSATTWSAGRSQKVMVLNQLIAENPNAMRSVKLFQTDTDAGTSGVDFSVNGRLRPKLKMQPGEVQLWRIVNASGRTAAYFMAPEGIEWRQIAQDGVQYADPPYQKSLNRPFYMAPANRVDLLVKAPLNPTAKSFDVRIQNVMARSMARPAPMQPGESMPGTVLLTVNVEGPAVAKDGQPAQMPFIAAAPRPPEFLRDITPWELELDNSVTRTLVFNSQGPQTPEQHTINGIQFGHENAHLDILLNKREEWIVKNLTINKDLKTNIDHPLHIHINPFQVTEFFDPNESLVDPVTGKLEAVVRDGTTKVVPRYVTDPAQLTDPTNPFAMRQCYIDPKNEATWSVSGARALQKINGKSSASGPCPPQYSEESKSIWRDVFAIPSARRAGGAVIPGYYKMRSRFVDYPGLYVMHCHILIHEDRGMMYSVEVLKAKTAPVRHH
jgi:FtsP/CotA-like multicopper oxidase with cupredoxin domain